jgi:hypothetical protein
MSRITLNGFKCDRPSCGHAWVPRDDAFYPKVCPRCKSPYWDRRPAEAHREPG